MQIPVILVAPQEVSFRYSAMAAMTNKAVGLDIKAAPSYPGVTLDAAFPAVPLGKMTSGAIMALADMRPDRPRATIVDFPVLKASYPGGGSIMSGTLSAALAAYGFMLGSRTAGGPLASYQAVVATNSWGIYHPSWDFPAGHPGRYCDESWSSL
jgi:hypothetical protein